jgi:23S rRNA (cytidine1920-2'-O)/16S rRNA (cytidine1409-2'-O)-methyltransferase
MPVAPPPQPPGPTGRGRRPKVRVDTLVFDRGLAPSRERARALILAGQVLVNGRAAGKPGTAVPADADVSLLRPDHPYVGRGGVKLAHALDAFAISVAGREALDIGASTGGFTDVLLQRGASRVVALDVGHGQLDWTLRNDPRVIVMERFNARSLGLADLPGRVEIVTIDVSFISLGRIFPRIPPLLGPGADVVGLVKPQFEAGRREVGRKGVIRDPRVQERVVAEAAKAAAEVGLMRVAMTESPITGETGNREFFLHLRQAGRPADDGSGTGR